MTALHVEWAKSYARATRWSEEVSLVIEEMRRVAVYLRWKAEWWQSRRAQRPSALSELQEGLDAYATRQAIILSSMRTRFSSSWFPALEAHSMALRGI